MMNATIVEVEERRLRNGKRLVVLGLDKSYLEVLRFEAPLGKNRPTSARKRRKAGLPEHAFYGVEIWLVPPAAPPRQVRGDFGFVDPITGPASLTLSDESAADIPIGSKLELRIRRTSPAR